jgi:hypothetical protein
MKNCRKALEKNKETWLTPSLGAGVEKSLASQLGLNSPELMYVYLESKKSN